MFFMEIIGLTKENIEKLFQENQFNELIDYIKEHSKCYDSKTNINKRRLHNSFELLRSLTHAYKCNYTLDECRKLFSLDEDYEKILSSLALSNFYINYIYDEKNLKNYFNYALLDFNDFKPKTIDYETDEYKNLLTELSKINKKIILEIFILLFCMFFLLIFSTYIILLYFSIFVKFVH